MVANETLFGPGITGVTNACAHDNNSYNILEA